MVSHSFMYWNSGMHNSSKNLGATSKFKVPEGWHEVVPYWLSTDVICHCTKLNHHGNLAPRICTPVTTYLVSDTAINILGCRSEASQCIRCTILMIAAHVLQLFSKEKQLKCVIIMEIIVQERKMLVFQNFVYSFSAT